MIYYVRAAFFVFFVLLMVERFAAGFIAGGAFDGMAGGP